MSGTERASRGAVVALLLLGSASSSVPGALAQSASTPPGSGSPAPTASPAVATPAPAAIPPGAPTPAAPGTPAAPAPPAPRLSRTQVIALAQKRYAARVLRASLSNQNGRLIYVLLMLSGSGKVWTVHVDASSGQEVP